MATFVLVHGAWHGGWCWRDVRRALAACGHEVFTPTLTGLADRAHLMSRDITIDTHIDDIANLMICEELEEVCLVGHSYAGQVISGVADRLKSRIAHMVYLDAYIGADGESTTSMRTRMQNPDATAADIQAAIAAREAKTDERGGSPCDYPTLFDIPESMGDAHAWVKRRITPQPIGAQTTPLTLRNGGSNGIPRTYVLCTGVVHRTSFMEVAEPLYSDPTWQVRELPTGHDAMVTMPLETAELLQQVCGAGT